MKKSILIFCAVITTFSLMAIGYIKTNHAKTEQGNPIDNVNIDLINGPNSFIDNLGAVDFIYKVESRFMTRITKEKLHNAKSIIDILPTKATNSVVSYQNVEVTILSGLDRRTEVQETGVGEVLNEAQLALLQSADYSKNVVIYANVLSKDSYTGEIEDNSISYHMTIVPEKEAEFKNGHDKLIEFIKTNSKEKETVINRNRLKPGRVSFTITEEGSISNIKLTSSSGYASIDESMLELIATTQGGWESAQNSNGEKVSQELILFFGMMGC